LPADLFLKQLAWRERKPPAPADYSMQALYRLLKLREGPAARAENHDRGPEEEGAAATSRLNGLGSQPPEIRR
jgi:hypothetical protein